MIATCPLKTPHIPSSYSNEQTTKETQAINNSYIYIHISCKWDTNRAGLFTLDAHASRPVACILIYAVRLILGTLSITTDYSYANMKIWIRGIWTVVFIVDSTSTILLDPIIYIMMYVLEWRTVYALTRGLFWCLFPSFGATREINQNNTRMGPWIVRHESTYIILFLARHNGSIIDIFHIESDWAPSHFGVLSLTGRSRDVLGSCMEGKCKHIDELVSEKRNSSVLAMELRLSCTNPSICPLRWDSPHNPRCATQS